MTLDAENHYIESQGGTQIDVSHDFSRAAFGEERILVRGTVLHIAIPYSGEQHLWRIRPSTFSLAGYPELEIRDDVVVFRCSFPDDAAEPQRLKAEIERTISSLSDAVSNLAKNVENHNIEAPRVVQATLERKLSNARAGSNRGSGTRDPHQAEIFARNVYCADEAPRVAGIASIGSEEEVRPGANPRPRGIRTHPERIAEYGAGH